jgi:uncharacterized RDD family membrane protein YckC
LLIEPARTSVGDYIVGTVVLHDPHDALLTHDPSTTSAVRSGR